MSIAHKGTEAIIIVRILLQYFVCEPKYFKYQENDTLYFPQIENCHIMQNVITKCRNLR